jgi:hypothetical protein
MTIRYLFIPKFSIPRHFKVYQNLDFWHANTTIWQLCFKRKQVLFAARNKVWFCALAWRSGGIVAAS